MRRQEFCSVPLQIAAALYFLSLPDPAHANVIWPGLVVGWMALVWSVPAGLLFEYLAVQKWLPDVTQPGKAVITANLISAAAGIVLFPILATMAEILPKTILAAPAEWSAAWDRNYHLLALLGLIPLAAIASTLIERAVMTAQFGLEPSRRSYKILFLANLVSAATAAFFAALFF